MQPRRPALLLYAALLAACPAGADDMMTVRLGGHQYRLPRAIDDGDSDHPEPGQPETILLRADLPDLTPHDETPDLKGIPAFTGKMVEILAQSVVAHPADLAKVTPALEQKRLQVRLMVLFGVLPWEPRPALVLIPTRTADLGPDGPDMHRIALPKPFGRPTEQIYINGSPDALSDVLDCDGGECSHWFLHNRAILQLTYGKHLVKSWARIRSMIASLLDRSEIHA